MQFEELFAMVFMAGMFAGVFVIFLAMRQRAELLQMQHRERMAMIERGQIPLSDSAHAHGASRRAGTTQTSRSLSLGIIVVGFGIALMTIVGVAGGSPEAGIGVGGAVAILGAAFIVRSLVVRPEPGASQEPPPVPGQLPSSSPAPGPPSDDRL
jgi:hypothetical protein